MALNTVMFDLGTAGDLDQLFVWSPTVKATPNDIGVLADAIEHAFNQTLLRDLMYGSWASVYPDYGDWDPSTVLQLRITSPSDAVQDYATIIPQFLAAMKTGLDIFNSAKVQRTLAVTKAAIIAEAKKKGDPIDPSDLNAFFLPPFGLSMQNSDSIQLLHYPPAETLTYMDYLYSPTNRRWENLLGYAGWPGAANTLLETITDIGPIAADGGSLGGDLIEPVLDDFEPYATQMLPALLRVSPSGKTTQPIVAYGGPVGEWLVKFFPNQITDPPLTINSYNGLDVCQAFTMKFFGDDGPLTPVLTANHPIKFNYYDSDYLDAIASSDPVKQVAQVDHDSFITLQQDLVAASWQAQMAATWKDDPDPAAALADAKNKWMVRTSPSFPKIYEIFQEQVVEFSLENVPAFQTEQWMAALVAATKDIPDGV